MLSEISRDLSLTLSKLTFEDPVTHVYDPTTYAWEIHAAYIYSFASEQEVLLLGMNPGPWGMAQSGVPFGEVNFVRDWMGLTGSVSKPEHEHPKRLVEGLDCPRSEVSGARLWGWAKERFGDAETFFNTFFVWNYCPLSFMEEGGRNRTPDKLPKTERETLFEACDDTLRQLVDALEPSWVVGVGAFAEKRARAALSDYDLEFARILHPSPASPKANSGWAEIVDQQLEELCQRGLPLDF